ncbi:MAG: hypothetical protein U1G07_22365 [Verrucomicrobiota bacterium]
MAIAHQPRSDGVVDKVFSRPCGRPLSKWLVHTPQPVPTWYRFLHRNWRDCRRPVCAGDYLSGLLGAILFQLSAIVTASMAI